MQKYQKSESSPASTERYQLVCRLESWGRSTMWRAAVLRVLRASQVSLLSIFPSLRELPPFPPASLDGCIRRSNTFSKPVTHQ